MHRWGWCDRARDGLQAAAKARRAPLFPRAALGPAELAKWGVRVDEQGAAMRRTQGTQLVRPWTTTRTRRLVQPGRHDDRTRRGSRSVLCARDLPNFGDDTVHDAVARALCALEPPRVPRKEFHESVAVVKRAMEAAPFEGRCAIDVCGGHGLVGALAVLLGGARSALCVDVSVPHYAHGLHAALVKAWPAQLAGRVRLAHGVKLEELRAHNHAVLFGIHACGPLTDAVIDLAIEWRAPVVAVPCCHDKKLAASLDSERVRALGGPLAVDVARAERLARAGFDVTLDVIDADITAQNRVLVARPADACAFASTGASRGDVGGALPPRALPSSAWRRWAL